jgi:predicted dehydrogenase
MGKILSVTYNYNNLNIAVIGCGNWGKNLSRVLHKLGALYAVCDIDPTKALTYGELYNVPHYNLEQILSMKEIDGVVIATPSTTHYEVGLACLRSNKHVFMEKPLSLTTQHATFLHQLAKQQQRVLMVGHLLQYHPAFNALKKLKKDGVLGNLQYIYSNRCNFGKFRTEENVLWDFAPHDVSMILSLIDDMPQRIFASRANHLMHTSLDTTCIQMSFPGNVKAHVFVSWLHPFKEQKLIAVGSKAMAIFDDCQPLENKLRLCRLPAEWSDGLPHPFPFEGESVLFEVSEPLMNECRQFLDSIQQKTLPLTDGLEGIKVMTVLEAASESMEKDEPVNISSSALAQKVRKHTDLQIEENSALESVI